MKRAPKRSVAGTLFFLPFNTVLEWAGAPKGNAAKYRWIAEQLKLESRVPMDDKTLRKVIRSPEKTSSRTRQEFFELQSTISLALGCPLPSDDSSLNALENHLRGQEWDGFSRHVDHNLHAGFLPRTREHIRTLAKMEAEAARGVATANDVQGAVLAFVENPLTRLLFPPHNTRWLKEAIRQLQTPEDLAQFRERPFFQTWYTHCVASLLMNILAQADIEFCREHILPEGATDGELAKKSMVFRILPRLTDGKLVRPIPALLEWWREAAGLPSYRQMASKIPGSLSLEEKTRKLRRWRLGKRVPKIASIEPFLGNLIRHETVRHVCLLRFRIACLLHELHEWTRTTAPEATPQERVRMFHTFARHRLQHLSRQGQCAPARR